MPETARQPLDASPSTAGLALVRALSTDQIAREIAQEARRAVPGDAAALALGDDDPAALRLHYQLGYGEADGELRQRLAPQWAEAVATGRIVVTTAAGATELTAPLTSGAGTNGAGTNGAGVLGALTVRTGPADVPQRVEAAHRVLAALAAQAVAAIGRVRLAEREERERRLDAVGQMAAGVAHELRNPLAGISSAAQLLRFRAHEDPVLEKNVGRILREVERLNRMVTALLDYGRPGTMHCAPADPDALWDAVLDGSRGLLESRALVVQRTRVQPAVTCALDAEQVAQLFANVLANAVEAAPEASDLTLASSALPTGAWRCRLHNGGAAVAPDTLARVFELFVSTKPGGTGIGLPLCQRIVEAHHGSIALESVPDVGTTVTIVLPPAAAAPSAASTP